MSTRMYKYNNNYIILIFGAFVIYQNVHWERKLACIITFLQLILHDMEL